MSIIIHVVTLKTHTHTYYVLASTIKHVVVHYNIRLSNVTFSNILDSDHLPIIFHILDHVKIRNLSETLKNSQIGNSFKALFLT
jgi:hypothetical protein